MSPTPYAHTYHPFSLCANRFPSHLQLRGQSMYAHLHTPGRLQSLGRQGPHWSWGSWASPGCPAVHMMVPLLLAPASEPRSSSALCKPCGDHVPIKAPPELLHSPEHTGFPEAWENQCGPCILKPDTDPNICAQGEPLRPSSRLPSQQSCDFTPPLRTKD